MSAQTQWFYDPEMLPGGPSCPRCRSTEPPRLVTFDGIDSGTGEQLHEERYRCSCGFQGETEEFQAGVGVDGETRARLSDGTDGPYGNVDGRHFPHTLPFGDAIGAEGRDIQPGVVPGSSEPHIGANANSRFNSGTPASISPRIERGTEDGRCPF